MKKYTKIFILLLILLFTFVNLDSQIVTDTIANTILMSDSTKNIEFIDSLAKVDSLVTDSIHSDTIEAPKDNSITAQIDFESADSMYISINNKQIILFGKGNIVTEGMNLKADSIGIDMDSKELKAGGTLDSMGRKQNTPIFKDKDKEYKAEYMRYNFETKKGIITNVMTKEQNDFLHGERVKIQSNEEMHLSGGKYTTCDHPHPHYYIKLTKAKILSNDRIVTGPFYFVIQDIPILIAAPFGFFPLSRNNSSGIHIPSYKDEIDLGFGLVGGGYYWAINDYVDLDIIGDFYSKGSWGVHLNSRFKKRYKFNGNVRIDYFHKQTGPKKLVTSKIGNTYNVQLSFLRDPKARPNSNLSASINYVRGDYRQYNSNNINDFVNTTTSSSVAYQKSFGSNRFRVSANMNMNQNLSDSTINLKFPTLNFNMNKITVQDIFMKDKPVKGRWYEKLGISYSSSFSNSIYTHDTILMNTKYIDSTLRALKSGYRYSIPLQTSLKLFNYINISPSIQYNAKIYPYKITKVSDGNTIRKDTTYGFNHIYEYSTSVSMSTRLYSMFKLNWGRLKAVRHVINPSISYGYKPDFSTDKWGYYADDPQNPELKYSYYDNFIFGTASRGEQQTLSFSIGNNIEGKIVSKDTSQNFKKIKLIDNLSLSQSYNFAKDSMKLSYLGINASLSPIPKTTVSFNSQISPYVMSKQGHEIDKLQFTENRKIGRLTSAYLSINTSFSSEDFKKNEENKSQFTWSTSINYSLRFSKNFNVTKQKFDSDLTQNASVSFKVAPTPLWDVSIRTGYDFDRSEITSTTFNFRRDLHCWEMILQVTPFGRMKSYFFKINIKSEIFKDIQLKKERSWHDNF